jgi:hypothetical protein
MPSAATDLLHRRSLVACGPLAARSAQALGMTTFLVGRAFAEPATSHFSPLTSHLRLLTANFSLSDPGACLAGLRHRAGHRRRSRRLRAVQTAGAGCGCGLWRTLHRARRGDHDPGRHLAALQARAARVSRRRTRTCLVAFSGVRSWQGPAAGVRRDRDAAGRGNAPKRGLSPQASLLIPAR